MIEIIELIDYLNFITVMVMDVGKIFKMTLNSTSLMNRSKLNKAKETSWKLRINFWHEGLR